MNRIIKFRAWTGNRMIDFKEVCDMRATPWNSTSLIWMQFTGLLDKNGKEIYEGDIATDINDESYQVQFSDGAFEVIHDGNVVEPLGELASDIEIIGNIYENPTLTKQEIK